MLQHFKKLSQWEDWWSQKQGSGTGSRGSFPPSSKNIPLPEWHVRGRENCLHSGVSTSIHICYTPVADMLPILKKIVVTDERSKHFENWEWFSLFYAHVVWLTSLKSSCINLKYAGFQTHVFLNQIAHFYWFILSDTWLWYFCMWVANICGVIDLFHSQAVCLGRRSTKYMIVKRYKCVYWRLL